MTGFYHRGIAYDEVLAERVRDSLFDMTGRPMRGIVVVAAETLDDAALGRWIARARRHVASLPPK